MPKLIIKRAKDFSAAARKFTLLIDGKEVGRIAHGGTEEYDVPVGTHSVNAKIDWCGSREFEFTVSENETKYLKVSRNRLGIFVSLAALIALLVCLGQKGRLEENVVFYVMVPLILYQVYQITLGRNNYLKIKEDEFYS